MAFTSKGYAGPVLPADWSLLVPGMASTYNVEDNGLATTSTGTLQTTTTAGTAAGYGITDTEVASTVLTYGANTVAGTTRYDLVVLRRTWASSSSALVVVPGNVSQTVAIGLRTSGRNVVDDQPIALVPIIQGASNPGTPIDLRLWTSSGGATANSVLVLQYLTAMGSQVQIGADLWQRVWVGGVATWVPNVRPQSGWMPFHRTAPESKTSSGEALTNWISVVGPPRIHAIRINVNGYGGFAGAATDVGVLIQRNQPAGTFEQDPSTGYCAAGKWLPLNGSARISGLAPGAVTQIRVAAAGDTAHRRGAMSWDVI